MNEELAISMLGRAIQFSLAPVFLLSGIGPILAVLSGRLSRIVDRARVLESRTEHATEEVVDRLHRELSTLSKRAKLVYRAITLCCFTAMCVCAVVASLFVAAFFDLSAGIPLAVLFVTAMSTFFAALLCFLREIFLATSNLRIGPH